MKIPLNGEFLKAAVYGANDGIITTFAVVAGVAGAGLSPKIVIVLGIANMMADAVSMGIGDFLGEKSQADLEKAESKKFKQSGLWKTGVITFGAFVLAGTMPLLPFVIELFGLPIPTNLQFRVSVIATGLALFIVGSLRTLVTKGSWIKNGFEMLSIGAIAATIAYFLGYFVENLVSNLG